ncbi:DUF418 domain-containing protein [Deinococcus radiophilus]|uniref:DUF418 domain-containing protein n=1 Tax=Deinococcus radiophilus TaxID=32062 RepID=UPI0014754EDC|nr:DUF418 domain-containing protein [Deinococcus radiophilus]UFA50276.1 DUF418 domain-containing protein [Deinococcus radiophilus]
MLAGLTALLTVWSQRSEARLLEVAGYDLDLTTLSALVGAAAITSGLWFWAARPGALAAPLRPLALLGRMSLSNYILQTLVFTVLGWAGWAGGPYWLVIPACLLAYAANLTLSAWWLPRYRIGPLEWLWRWGSTLKRPALARA